ncbi:exopolyphosphatase / guanosine-5'-triphosphate,3'-diphosphate pyrophosphatase [Sphingomonas guangdongensis]|uniref:Exopolyphosphatase / guanosine-5'-triphosphate,3'-diphosphate pyrophosphatase n=1 Tax=Sphingomonas guangdongensis TaxID=1141890 RepID=A0A285R0A6_9SPHN|nr:Ppx/GppA family phosphatase [Sphingomonas guangdongensis]SOB87556.1 exopolyphosphatase / guanosine-5'-triphosphate,3'-diphosphate pyrophosphatase [Sphingomonas guangdongensis]
MTRPARRPQIAPDQRAAIIDIGSNSIRLVVYEGAARLPATLFNEKVAAGLGRSLSQTGAIEPDAMKVAQGALARFAWLAREMEVASLRTVATAAVRDATNGAELLRHATSLGLDAQILSGEEEASAAGHGVLSAFPDADGIVGDLGGGSLELVRVVAGTITDRASFPLGVLRLAAIRAGGRGALERRVRDLLGSAGWSGRGRGLPLYMVGGSWRALVRLDMHLTAYPLPVIHGYGLSAADVDRIADRLKGMDRPQLKAITDLSSSRIPTLDDATRLLGIVMATLGSEQAVASTFGLREGLLYAELSPEQRAQDPLIVATREEGRRLGRFAEHGDLLDAWIAPLFAGEQPALARLRHAACLLADVGWHANPQFRAEYGVEIALHGHWVGIDAAGRAIVAQALHSALGGKTDTPALLAALAPADALAAATRWGLAMRLGQRLSGGVPAPLERTRLVRGATLRLVVPEGERALYGEAVEKRHRAVAAALGLSAEFALDQPQ